MKRSIRPMEISDLDLMIDYFLQADREFLRGMGVEPSKLPSSEKWHQLLEEDFQQPRELKKFYYLIWEIDNRPVGHSNINKITFRQEAYMHLHIWQKGQRKQGNGTCFVQESISHYFEKFQLQNIFCEPYSLNKSPNKTLPKAGFKFIKTYEPEIGWINFRQLVNRWVISKEQWLQKSSHL